MTQTILDSLNLIVRDMDATLAFYRAIGLDVPDDAVWRTESGAHHVEITTEGGVDLAFDSETLAGEYDAGWRAPIGPGARAILGFRVASREDVDRIHASLTRAGHPSQQAPYDAFWGSRYAILEDPDGNPVGIMSPSNPDLRRPPPNL